MSWKMTSILLAGVLTSGAALAALEGDAVWEAKAEKDKSGSTSPESVEADAQWEAAVNELKARAAAGDRDAKQTLRLMGIKV